MKNILLSGATGLIGSSLMEHLDGPHRVDVVTTSPGNARQKLGAGRSYYRWSEISEEGGGILADYDVVINLAGAPIISRWTEQARKAIRQSRVGLTTLLVEKIAECGGRAPRLLNASSTYIYGYHPDIRKQKDAVFDEHSPVDQYGSDNFIVNVCRSWEQALTPLDATGRALALRIGVVLSARGGVLPPMVKYARLGLGGNVGTGLQPFPWISITDAVRAVAFIIEREDIHGPVNLVAPENITQGRAGATISRILRRPAVVGMPAFLIKALYGEMGVQATLNGSQVHPGVLLASGFEFVDMSVSGAVRRLLDERSGCH